MKRKALLLVLYSFLMFSSNVYAAEDIDWKNNEEWNLEEVQVEKLKTFVKGTDVPEGASLQGITVTDKYIVFADVKSNTDNTLIYFVDKNTYEIVNVIDDYCFGHAGVFAYNRDKDEIAILYYDYVDEEDRIAFLDNTKMTFKNETKMSRQFYGIAYDYINKNYITIRNFKIFNLDENYNWKLGYYITENHLTHAGISYYDDHVFYSNYESGRESTYQSIEYNSVEKNSNLIFIYDNTGNLVKTLYIPYTSVYGEIEGAGFTEDGELILGYNTDYWMTISLYKVKYDLASLQYKITLDSDEEINDNSYQFKLVDEDGNVIQEKSNIGDTVTFDAINDISVGVYNYKIIDEQTNKEYNVVSKVKGNPINVSYEAETTYDDNMYLVINIEKNDIDSTDEEISSDEKEIDKSIEIDNSQDDNKTIIENIPNTWVGKNIAYFISGFIIIIVGIVIVLKFIKLKKSNKEK